MSRNKGSRTVILPLLALSAVAAWPSSAEAQQRAVPRAPAVRSVVVAGGYGYPRYPYFYRPYFYRPWFSPWYGPWYPYGLWGPYPAYGYGFQDVLTSAVRLEVTPREAEVYVDGYNAGRVDDYDGMFQRLRLRPGSHEIVIYLAGYRTVRQNLYLNPGSDQKVRYTLEPLGAGEVPEPPPPPRAAPDEMDAEPPRSRFPLEPEPQQPPQPEPAARFGTLSLRVTPADVEILVDGERWTAPAGEDRVAIQLAEGRHRIEVRKSGYAVYREDVLIRPNRSLTLNVSLSRGDATP